MLHNRQVSMKWLINKEVTKKKWIKNKKKKHMSFDWSTEMMVKVKQNPK